MALTTGIVHWLSHCKYFSSQGKLNWVKLLAGPFFHQAPASGHFPLGLFEPTCESNYCLGHSSWDHQQIQAYKQPGEYEMCKLGDTPLTSFYTHKKKVNITRRVLT